MLAPYPSQRSDPMRAILLSLSLLLASLFAMLSAAAGNLLRMGQPWTQLVPSVLGLICIAWFWRRQYRQEQARRHMLKLAT